MVLSSLPRVIETEGALRRGEIGQPIDAYLVLDVDYVEWWATQTYGPLVCPVEAEVYSYSLLFILFYLFV